MRKIIHCDCDCFFAAVEMRDNPEYRGIPLAVGGSSDRRGVIATCNYEARKFGVRSAMPTKTALRLCPHLKVIPGNMAKYKEVSQQIMEIYQSVTSLIEPLSIDEAYLDVSESSVCDGNATEIAKYLRQEVEAATGITISAGVAPNKFLAKIASDWRKPNGLFVIKPHQIERFLEALPVDRLHGVGKKTAERLQQRGIHTCLDLRGRPLSGAEFIPWIIVGMMTFFVFREGFLRSIGAISANHGLFSYRQVKPVDTVIVRGMVEGLLKTLIFAILIMLLTFFDVECLPDDPLAVIKVWLNAWILGLGFGLFLSALNALVREVSIIVKVITLPMYFLSGVMLPFNFLPHEIQAYVLYNPVLHLVELNRGAFFENYNPVYGVNLEYAVLWSLITIALGLIMHLRFEFRIKAQ
jgi:ABC-type polysaccharide/polyol phosphate export permease